MKCTVLCLEEGERISTFDGNKRRYYEASVRDYSKEGKRCTNNFTVRLTPEQEAKFSGKMRDVTFELEIHTLRASGTGVTVEGLVEPAKNGGNAKASQP
jgi:hypothetical protein